MQTTKFGDRHVAGAHPISVNLIVNEGATCKDGYMTESWQDRIIYMEPAEDLISLAVQESDPWLHRIYDSDLR
jgi:hypothetical protein